jgi:hypothetical protein
VPENAAGRRRPLLIAAAIAALVYGSWFTARKPFSASAHIALLIIVVAVIAFAEWQRERPAPTARDKATRAAPYFRIAVVVWTAIVTAVVVWEVIALRASPRTEHPTISYIVEQSEHHHLARLALYAVWIWLGWEIAS